MNVERPRGTRDFTPEVMSKRKAAESAIKTVFESYGYSEVSVPCFEHLDLFKVKSGEEIQEHMYVFKDKSDRELCLRPEATASVCRMFKDELRDKPRPLKLYYSCPMYRYERPQKGRYREFWQMGVELIGAAGVEADAEAIALAVDCLQKLGLKFNLEVGHIGVIRGLLTDLKVEPTRQDKIISDIDKGDIGYLRDEYDGVVYNIINRFVESGRSISPLRKIIENYPSSLAAFDKLEELCSLLDKLEIDYTARPGIARGLEYYTGMVFEVRVDGLGAQDQVCGGGRYDQLIELFSGVSVPAVGFAFGFDRVVEAMDHQGIESPLKQVDVVVAPVNESVRPQAWSIAKKLRKDSVKVDLDLMNRKLSKILEYASNINARYAAIVGPKELEENKVTLRDMESGEQKTIGVDEIGKLL